MGKNNSIKRIAQAAAGLALASIFTCENIRHQESSLFHSPQTQTRNQIYTESARVKPNPTTRQTVHDEKIPMTRECQAILQYSENRKINYEN